MNSGNGRKAQLFQRAIRNARRREETTGRPQPAAAHEETEIKANEVEKMHIRIESAFRAAQAA